MRARYFLGNRFANIGRLTSTSEIGEKILPHYSVRYSFSNPKKETKEGRACRVLKSAKIAKKCYKMFDCMRKLWVNVSA